VDQSRLHSASCSNLHFVNRPHQIRKIKRGSRSSSTTSSSSIVCSSAVVAAPAPAPAPLAVPAPALRCSGNRVTSTPSHRARCLRREHLRCPHQYTRPPPTLARIRSFGLPTRLAHLTPARRPQRLQIGQATQQPPPLPPPPRRTRPSRALRHRTPPMPTLPPRPTRATSECSAAGARRPLPRPRRTLHTMRELRCQWPASRRAPSLAAAAAAAAAAAVAAATPARPPPHHTPPSHRIHPVVVRQA
jgi:hypothetical protein